MNEDLYDTGSAVVGLYRYQLFEIPWGIPRTGWIHLGGGGGECLVLIKHSFKQCFKIPKSHYMHSKDPVSP